MALLLDTHTLIWWLTASRRLSAAAREAIASGHVYVSVASAWEIGIKRARGKLTLEVDLADQLRRNAFEPLPITLAHALRAGSLPLHHADPFDRMLVAQAQLEGLRLVTGDPRIARYDVRTLAAT